MIARCLAAVAVLALCGCGDEATKTAEPERSIDFVAFHSFTMGEAAEMRVWQFRDGSRWLVIGRGSGDTGFLVYRDTGAGWEPIGSAGLAKLPAVVAVTVEAKP